MNKLFIGLLVVAAGAGIFLLLNKKKNTTEVETINKELIIGKWKTDAVLPTDSTFNQYHYNFQKEGNVLITSPADSVKTDTTHYEWNKTNELVWKGKATDSTGEKFSIVKLTPDSLQLRTADSATVLFTKVK